MERFVTCVIFGHGDYPTLKRSDGLDNIVLRETPIDLFICNFAEPGNVCKHIPDILQQIIECIITNTSENNFKKIVENCQIANIGTTHSQWWMTKESARDYNRTEQWINGRQYYEKIFTNFKSEEEREFGGKSGVYIGRNNIGIPVGTILFSNEVNEKYTLSMVIDYFTGIGVNRLYMLDTTCSIFLDGEGKDITDAYTIRHNRLNIQRLISRDPVPDYPSISGPFSFGGKYKNKKSTRKYKQKFRAYHRQTTASKKYKSIKNKRKTRKIIKNSKTK